MKTAVFFSIKDKMLIRAGKKGAGRIIAEQSFQRHQCNAGCRCDEIRAEYKARLYSSVEREGYLIKDAFEMGLC